MAGIVGFATAKDVLLQCEEFNNDAALRAVFVDARIAVWRDSVPQAGSVGERVQTTMGWLHGKADQAGRNGLVLLVEVLRDIYDKMDARHGALGDLARQMEQHGVDMPHYEPLRDMYLRRLKQEVNQLPSLPFIETTREADTHMELAKVYTALLTLGGDEQERERMMMREEKPKPVSSLEQLNRHNRLVLIGAPGSGKSTFVDFVVMCMAGEWLGDEQINLQLLQTPLPKEEGDKEEPKPQPWNWGALLPIKIELRRFVSVALAAPEKITSEQVWTYLSQQLPEDVREYVPMLKERFREKGGMVLFDGLDEIPDPDQSCPRLKAVIEDMATCYPKCRIVVTSRPYAYQNPKWQLREFAQATLAPFSEGQIKQFIQGWYGYLRHYYKWSEEIQQARAQQLDQAIFSRHRQMRSLAERPLLLTLMVNLHAKTGRLPEKRAELYEETVKLLLDRWERGRLGQTGAITKSLSEYLETNQDDIRRLLDSLAYEAHAHQPQNVGDTANLDGFKLLNGLMKLTLKKIDTNELLGYLNDRAGILENVAEGIYRFPHRTFQEYMAASYLTSRDDFAAETAELVRGDTNRWREVALLAGAKASSGMAGAVWQLVDELCVDEAAGPGAAPADLMAGLIAGQAILESANLNQVSPAGKKKIKRVKGWLEALMVSRLPVLERVTAGQVLAKLGDERKGVGVREV